MSLAAVQGPTIETTSASNVLFLDLLEVADMGNADRLDWMLDGSPITFFTDHSGVRELSSYPYDISRCLPSTRNSRSSAPSKT